MVEIGYRSAVRVLIENGADLFAQNSGGETAMNLARQLETPSMSAYSQACVTGHHNSTFGQLQKGATDRIVWYRTHRGYGYSSDDITHFGLLSVSSAVPPVVEEDKGVTFSVCRDRFGLKACSFVM